MVSQKKILVVDDDSDVVDLISLILKVHGYNVFSAESGKECFKILKNKNPDLVILDIMMETITEGIRICYEIKNNLKYQIIPVILISSIDKSMGFHVDAEFLKAEKFLEKPLEPDILVENIENIFKIA